MGCDQALLKIVPTILRMDRRICRIEVQCCWYEPNQDGQPCTESVDNCDYIQKLVSETETEIESEKDSEIEGLRDQVESRESQMTDLKNALEQYENLDESLPGLQKQLTKVLEQLSILKVKKDTEPKE